MGLTGFYPLLRANGYAPTEITAEALRGRTVAIDGDAMLYRALHGYTTGAPSATELTACIARWLQRAAELGVSVIFVVTGGPAPPEKERCCGKRRKRRRDAQLARADALEASLAGVTCPGTTVDTLDRAARLRDSARCIVSGTRSAVVRALREAGFVCREAVSEADMLLVQLAERSECHLVAADDADLLVSGAPRLLRGLGSLLAGDDATRPLRLYERGAILASLGIDADQLLQLGTLLACDYQPPIHNVGPKTALRVIKRHGSIAAFLGSEEFTSVTRSKRRKYTLPDGMSGPEYLRACGRSVDILRSRPDV